MRLWNTTMRALAVSSFLLIMGLGPAIAFAETIPMKKEGGVFVVPVSVNGQITLDFIIDTGASDVSIPADVISTLIRTGTLAESDILEPQAYQLADGSTKNSERVRIRSLRVGNTEVRNVTASVAPAAGPLLLGQGFLSRLPNWSVDNSRHVLMINETAVSREDGADQTAQMPQPRKTIGPGFKLLGLFSRIEPPSQTFEVYVDTTEIKIKEDTRSAWFWFRAQSKNPPKDPHEAATDIFTLSVFDCERRTSGDILSIEKKYDGTLKKYDLSKNNMRPADPGSLDEKQLIFVCSWPQP